MSPVPSIRVVLLTLLAVLAGAVAPSSALAVLYGSGQNRSFAAPDGAYPWTVAILEKGGTPQSQFCGGTLIGEMRVLTAAHCIDPGGVNQATPDSIDVLVGQTSLAATGCVPTPSAPCPTDTAFQRGVRLGVTDISLHERTDILQVGSDLDHFYYDVAVLTLDRRVPADWVVEPVAAAGEGIAEATGAPDAWGAATSTTRGVSTFVAGWGMTVESGGMAPNVLRFGGGASMERLGDGTCLSRLLGGFRAEDMLCVGPANPTESGVDACQGDSGGPLLKRSPVSTFQARTTADAYRWATTERLPAMSGPEILAAVQQDAAATGVDRVPVATVDGWRAQIRSAIEGNDARLADWEADIRDALTPQERALSADEQNRIVASRLGARIDTEVTAATNRKILAGTSSVYGSLYLQDRKQKLDDETASYARQGRHWRLVGVVSWGEGCGRPGKPGVYARVGAPAIRDYVTSPAPASMPRVVGAAGPHVVGRYAIGETVTCDPGQWVGAASYSYVLWRDANGDGSRSAEDRTLSTTRADYRLSTADITGLRASDLARGTVGIGCTVRARGQGGYGTVAGAVTPVPLALPASQTPEAPAPGPPATAPTPAPAPTGPVDRAAPQLAKKAAVCAKSTCRISITALDRGTAASGLKTVVAYFTLGRAARCRVTKGKDKGKLRACTRTTTETIKPKRSGDQWVVNLKGLRRTDTLKLRFKGTDRAGNAANLVVPIKLRLRR